MVDILSSLQAAPSKVSSNDSANLIPAKSDNSSSDNSNGLFASMVNSAVQANETTKTNETPVKEIIEKVEEESTEELNAVVSSLQTVLHSLEVVKIDDVAQADIAALDTALLGVLENILTDENSITNDIAELPADVLELANEMVEVLKEALSSVVGEDAPRAQAILSTLENSTPEECAKYALNAFDVLDDLSWAEGLSEINLASEIAISDEIVNQETLNAENNDEAALPLTPAPIATTTPLETEQATAAPVLAMPIVDEDVEIENKTQLNTEAEIIADEEVALEQSQEDADLASDERENSTSLETEGEVDDEAAIKSDTPNVEMRPLDSETEDIAQKLNAKIEVSSTPKTPSVEALPVDEVSETPAVKGTTFDSTQVAPVATQSTPEVSEGKAAVEIEQPKQVVMERTQSIVRAAKLSHSEGGSTVTIRLNPPELGPMEIKIEVREGVTTANIRITTEAARDALQGSIPDLREALQRDGVNVVQVDVELSDREADENNQYNTTDRDNEAEVRQENEDEAEENQQKGEDDNKNLKDGMDFQA